MKKVSVKIDLFMTDAFIEEWVTNNIFFGEGQEVKYGEGYVKHALEYYIIDHGAKGISFKHKLLGHKNVRSSNRSPKDV